MKIVGVLFIVLALAVGYASGSVIDQLWIERVVGFAFTSFLIGIFILIKDKNTTPTPLKRGARNSKECICNDIGEHSPGGRCEADHSRPEFPKDRVRTDKTSWEDRRF